MQTEVVHVEIVELPFWPMIGLTLLGIVALALIISLIAFRKK